MSEEHDDPVRLKAPIPPALDAFLRAEARTLEAVRQEHCATCQGMAADGVASSSQLFACNQLRCGLRDAEQFRVEILWAAVTLSQLVPPAYPSDEVISAFNEHVALSGCATIGLARDDQGLPTLGFVTSTLRARIHADIVGYLTARTGVQVLPPTARIGAAQSLIRDRRTSRLELMKQRAMALRTEGLSDKKIAQRLKVDPKTIRNWIGNREEG